MIVVVSWGKDFSCASTQLCSKDFLTLWNPSHYFSLSFWQVLCCRFQCCKEGLAGKSPRKAPSSRSAGGCLCSMKARTGPNSAFLKQPWRNRARMLFAKASRMLLCAQKATDVCTSKQPSALALCGAAQQLEGPGVPLLCNQTPQNHGTVRAGRHLWRVVWPHHCWVSASNTRKGCP